MRFKLSGIAFNQRLNSYYHFSRISLKAAKKATYQELILRFFLGGILTLLVYMLGFADGGQCGAQLFLSTAIFFKFI